ncbi:putative pectate lyase 22 [Nymphaea thermarum]|nr:putative pectate lyase 22 [Nymphaea thermarum]
MVSDAENDFLLHIITREEVLEAIQSLDNDSAAVQDFFVKGKMACASGRPGLVGPVLGPGKTWPGPDRPARRRPGSPDYWAPAPPPPVLCLSFPLLVSLPLPSPLPSPSPTHLSPSPFHLLSLPPPQLTCLPPPSLSSPFPLPNSPAPHHHHNVSVYDPEAIVLSVQMKVEESVRRRRMLGSGGGSCMTGNPIDDCWRCDPNWARNQLSFMEARKQEVEDEEDKERWGATTHLKNMAAATTTNDDGDPAGTGTPSWRGGAVGSGCWAWPPWGQPSPSSSSSPFLSPSSHGGTSRPARPTKQAGLGLIFGGQARYLARPENIIGPMPTPNFEIKSQCIVLSVEYWLAPEHRVPAAYKDCHEAVTWLSSKGSAGKKWLS